MISSRANGPLNDSVEEFHGPKRSSLTDVRGVPQKRRDAGLVIFAPPELPPAASGAQSAKQEHLLARSSTSSSSSGKLVRLHKAARQGLLDVIDRALRASPGLVDSRDEAGRTPLHWAARKNRNRVAELLLALGADANAIDNDGMCPMHLSAACGMETNTASSSSSSVFDSCSSERVFTVHDVVDLRQDMDSARRRTDRCSFVLPHAGFTVPGQTSSEPDVPFPPPQPHEAGAVVIVGSSLMRSSFRPDFVELLDSVENGAQSTRIQGRLGGIQRVSSACRRTGCESSRAGGGAANECQPPDAQPRHRPIGRSETISSPRGCESKAGILAIMGDRDDAEPSRPAAAKTNTWVNPCPSEFESTDLWKTVSETPRPSTDGSDVIAFVPRQTKTKTVMDMLLNHGAEIDARDANGRTPLHWAAWKGRDDSVAWLLRHGAQPHVADGDGRCAIHLASISGSLMALRELLRDGTDWEAKDRAGRTALHLAAYWNQTPIVRELMVRFGCDSTLDHQASEARDDDECTPLQLAAWKGHTGAVEELLWRGADPEAANKAGHTALHFAAAEGRQRVSELLLEAGADPGARDNADRSPLHTAAASGHVMICRELLRRGAALNVCDEHGATPLHLAASGGHGSTVTELLHGGADPEARDYAGRTALHCAAASGVADAVSAVLSATGAAAASSPLAGGLLAMDRRGWTPLHVASSRGHAAAARLLLAGGAAVKVQDAAGQLAIHVAAAAGHAKIVELLIRRKRQTIHARDRSGSTPLLLALTQPQGGAVASALLDAGDDPDTINTLTGRTALSLAAERGGPELLTLLRHGASVDAPCSDGRRALHWAVDAQQVQAAEELLVAGASVGCADAEGRTPLHWAAGRGAIEVLKVLVAAGAGVNDQDSVGRTPLHYAARMGHSRAAEELLVAGAKRGIKDSGGKTASQYGRGGWKMPGGSSNPAAAVRRFFSACTHPGAVSS